MGAQYRHGDVLIEAVTSLPGGPKLPHKILAHGEVTGHCHRVQGEADLYQGPQELYLHVRGDSVCVLHEEHAPIMLPSGFYRVWRQREYLPEAIRTVRD